MKFFETPIMNISMFESENVVTDPSVVEPTQDTLVDTKAAVTAAGITEENTFTFTF